MGVLMNVVQKNIDFVFFFSNKICPFLLKLRFLLFLLMAAQNHLKFQSVQMRGREEKVTLVFSRHRECIPGHRQDPFFYCLRSMVCS